MHTRRDIGLYVHIPFCRQRCHFCAFYLEVARRERIDAFCAAIEEEIRLCKEQDLVGGRSLTSVYFGGGTPTAMPAQKVTEVLRHIRTAWPMHPDIEITVEAHPATVTPDDLRTLAAAGFNRISFGAESMNARDLRVIGRPGTVGDTRMAVAQARAAGFTNINLDLMYGLPGQTLRAWNETLKAVLELDPSHLSCYALTIEEGTKLAQAVEQHVLMPPDESLQIDMQASAEAILLSSCFRRYEISNYAKPGSACRHNMLYWTDQDYLGLGPSAQSYVHGVRFGDIADLTAYVDLLGKGMLPVTERTQLSAIEQQRDALVFGLRLLDGISFDGNNNDLINEAPAIEGLKIRGLIEATADRIKLTPLGQRYADSVAAELF